MSNHNYNVSVADLLAPLVATAHGVGANDMRALESALIAFARKVSEVRDAMPCHPVWHCRDCGKDWSVTITVKEERERFDPNNCPACYNAAQIAKLREEDGPSRWTDRYKYVEAGKANCGCVYHAEDGRPCEHDAALAMKG